MPYTLLRDDKNIYADKVAAKSTPHVFIVDAKGKLAYRGAFDNRSKAEESGTQNYVAQALDALLTNTTITTPITSPWGCNIKRD